MKKIPLLVAFLLVGLLFTSAWGDRETSTITEYSSTQLVKRGDWKIYRTYFNPTGAGGFFAIHDCLILADTATTNVKTEGIEATANNGQPQDFTGKPLEGSNGLFVVITTGKLLIEYE